MIGRRVFVYLSDVVLALEFGAGTLRITGD